MMNMTDWTKIAHNVGRQLNLAHPPTRRWLTTLLLGGVIGLLAVGWVGDWMAIAQEAKEAAPIVEASAEPVAARDSQTPLTLVKTKRSILDVANDYEGKLSRPLIPETSLFTPFWVQVAISAILIIVMLVCAFFFKGAHLFVMGLTIFSMLRHLTWRVVDTLDFFHPWNVVVGAIVFMAEVLAFISMTLGYFQIVGETNHESIPIDDVSPAQLQLPSVDVMFCTYNEPVAVLYRSLVGALNIDYAHKTVYLLDDGDRDDMRRLAEHLGVHYISRSDNVHAKAGNLNNALKHTNGEYVLVFDADHVPCKEFLQETVGFFLDNDELAYVQTPQHFFTEDPFQRNLISEDVVNNEQDLFFQVIQPGNDFWDACFFAGSGAVFRRDALDDVDGFAVETITEDVHTGIRMHSKGWKSLYYRKNLSAGLASESFEDFAKQRIRWSRGMTQVLFHDNPLFAPGLSLGQRLCYFAGIWYFFNGLARLIFLLAPLAFLMFGLKTVDSGILEIFVFYLPSFVCLIWGYPIITRGHRHSFWAELYETAMCVFLFTTNVLTLINPFEGSFRVTPKAGIKEGLSFNWAVVFPQIVIGALIIIGLFFSVMRAMYTPEYWGGIYANLLWAAYNLILIVGAVYVAQERPQYRLSPRVYRNVRADLRLLDGTIAVGYSSDISETGVGLVFEEPIPISGTLSLKMMDWALNEISVFQVQAVRSSRDEQGRFYVGFRVVNRTEEQHQKLIRHMFSSHEIWEHETVTHSNTGKSFAKLLSVPFRLSDYKEQASHRRSLRMHMQLPCRVRINGEEFEGLSDNMSETGVAVYLKEGASELGVGSVMDYAVQWPDGESTQVQGEVRRARRLADGRSEFGMNFINLTRQQRLDIMGHIYQQADGLVRVAPTVIKQVPCQIRQMDGHIASGVTQEVSEMGMVVALSDDTQLQPGEPVDAGVVWNPGESPQAYPAVIKDIVVAQNGQRVALVYFRQMDLKSLDRISKHLYDTEQEQKALKVI